MEKTKRDWPLLFTIAGSALGIIGTSVGLWIHIDNKFESYQIAMSQTISNIALETKDFHGRLCALEEKYHQMERK